MFALELIREVALLVLILVSIYTVLVVGRHYARLPTGR